MTKFVISTGVIVSEHEGATENEAIAAFVADAGYASVEDAAAACDKSVEEFLAAIHVEAAA